MFYLLDGVRIKGTLLALATESNLSLEDICSYKDAIALGLTTEDLWVLDIDGDSSVRWARSKGLLDGESPKFIEQHLLITSKEYLVQLLNNLQKFQRI